LAHNIKSNKAQRLIIHDEGVRTLPADYSKKLHQNWPKSKLVITQGFDNKLRDLSIVTLVGEFELSE
tara:strand:+ start:406 stop:606 length:201 start_codon:yes stop_codon:yes gene_type:complete